MNGEDQQQNVQQQNTEPQQNVHHPNAHIVTHQILPVVIAAIFLVGPPGLFVYLAQSSRESTEADYYQQAANQARWPDPRLVSKTLDGFKPDEPVKVVTWTQHQWVSSYQQPDSKTGVDVWVTKLDSLKKFCQDYVRWSGANGDQLALRLKERLGLPPDAAYDTFVELSLDPKDKDRLFRPCGDPSINTTTCNPPLPAAAADVWSNQPGRNQSQNQFKDEIREWMLRNYYSNYTSQDPHPWTELGYTFDWAREGFSNDFNRYGESEFVIPEGTPVHFVSAATTMAYCTPRNH
jgi:hypothetical protein